MSSVATLQARLGDLLVERGLVSPGQLEEALGRQGREGRRLGEVLVGMGAITEEQLTWALSEALHVPFVELADDMIDLEAVRSLPEEVLRRHEAVPILRSGDDLTVILADPTNRRAIVELEALSRARIVPAVATRDAVRRFLDRAFPPAPGLGPPAPHLSGDSEDLSGVTQVFALLLGAVRDRIGELYVEPSPDHVVVRARVEGRLVERARFPRELLGPLTFRLRVLGGIPPGAPTTATARVRTRLGGQAVDLELLFFATRVGEAVVVRLREGREEAPALDALGLTPSVRAALAALLAGPAEAAGAGGIVLVAGTDAPARTDVLYALAQAVARPERRMLTLERRAGYVVPAFVQVELGEAFAAEAPAALAQPADVILVEDVLPAPIVAGVLARAEEGTLVLAGIGLASSRSALAYLAGADLRGPLLDVTRGVVEVRRRPEGPAVGLVTLTPALRRGLLERRDLWTSPSS